ncbi:MAG: XrtN system VIT domain-containing protein, partial [Bacteroidota bacterium]
SMKIEKHLLIGLILIVLSTLLYAVEIYFDTADGNDLLSGAFFLHFLMSLIYVVIVFFNERKFWQLFQGRSFTAHTFLLVLFNLSAYSLNRNLPVFNESVDWLTIFLLIENILLVGYALLETRFQFLKLLISFFFSIALLFNLYQLLMVLPGSLFALMVSPFFGISLLLFVPLFYLVCIVTLLRPLLRETACKRAFVTGLILTFLVVTLYVVQFHRQEKQILDARLTVDAPFSESLNLPYWIAIAQVIDDQGLSEKYLKMGLIYQYFPKYDGDLFSVIRRSPFRDRFLHDPLISISSIFTDPDALDERTKIKVINYLYDARHQTADRFWSDLNLSTQQVVTNVELFPIERLSFTELIISIRNHIDPNRVWRSQQEALYTFNLPEGGVVTSLSLWINGIEEHGILTSQKKAQKAYNTIVGREARDPSVVYWMEGNKIRVRVFPCTPEEDRKFKIGITAPLHDNGTTLSYQSVSFKGPDPADAQSAINIVNRGAEIISSSIDLDQGMDYLSWQGGYEPSWQFNISPSATRPSQFSFRNQSFTVEKSVKRTRELSPKKVYLDLSRAWTKEELLQIVQITGDSEVIVFDGTLRTISDTEEL